MQYLDKDPSKNQHRVVCRGTQAATLIRFRWNFPRGTLQPKMSALELATFLVPHMPYVLPLFRDYPRVYAEFEAMLKMLVLTPADVLDQLIPWVKATCRTSDFDYIDMCISDTKPEATTKKYFIMKMVK